MTSYAVFDFAAWIRLPSRLVANVVVKMAPIGTQTRNCFSRVRRSAGLSIPGRDTYFMLSSVFICALRSLYSALQCQSITVLLINEFNSTNKIRLNKLFDARTVIVWRVITLSYERDEILGG